MKNWFCLTIYESYLYDDENGEMDDEIDLIE